MNVSDGGAFGNDAEKVIFDEIRNNGSLNDVQLQAIRDTLQKTLNFHPKIGVMGKTGAGKSSLCNALFGKPIAKVSHVGGGTRAAQDIEIDAGRGKGITLRDVPGVGESEARDEEYFQLYREVLPQLDAVLWVIKGDERAFSIDERTHREVVVPALKGKNIPIIFVVTQLCKVDPLFDWDQANNRPGLAKLKNIEEQLTLVSKAFDVAPSKVVGVSADEGYGLTELVDKLVVCLPAEKQYGFVREAKPNVVSDSARSVASSGVWETIKRTVAEVAMEHGPAIIKAVAGPVLGWLGKKLFGR